MSIRRRSLGLLRWQKTFSFGISRLSSSSDQQSFSIGYSSGSYTAAYLASISRFCPGFEKYEDRMLDAGPFTLQGPTFESVRFEPKLADGQITYSVSLTKSGSDMNAW